MASPARRSVGRDALERRVLDLVAGLAAELGGPAAGRPVALDDHLDRDLGLGSLERVELLVRIEDALHVRLPDEAMASAETPGDLVAAILAAAPAAPEALPEVRAPLRAGVPAPASAGTLVEVLRWHAETDPGRVHVFLREDDGRERPIRYGELWNGAAAIAAGLRERGLGSGERVALMLRTEEAFFTAFFGTLVAGGVPVPIYPPFRADRIEEYARRQVGILRNAAVRLLVTFDEAERVAGLLRSRVPSLDEVTTPARLALAGETPSPADLRAESPALIQYTSGSTGEPKGVLLTHANLLANIRGIGRALAIGPEDVGVSWLPLYHDMGLIGTWLGALYFGVPVAILSPLAFLARPARWLHAIHAHRGTISPAPNFAFDLCVRKVRDDEIAGLDLRCWRLALNGAEPVSPETIERFTRRFAPYGFRPEAMCPVYGLAESSVALTIPPLARPPRIDAVDREAFSRTRQARPAAPGDATALRFVSCGRPLPEHEIRVVDAAGHALGERVEGRIELRGPSVTSGYFRNPELTRAALRDGWMDSGDLGYHAGGELFITGRRKDVIIKAGRNLYPQEVEELVGEVPGVRKGCVAAFGVADPALGTERLVVVAESRETAAESRERLRAAVLERVVAALGVPADTVLIAPPGSVLKTSSGKIRRAATREAYLRGTLGRRRRPAPLQWARLVAAALGARLGRAGRRAATLAYAAWVGALLLVLLPPLWLGVLLAPPRAAERAVRAWCRAILALAGCRLHATGLEHLPAGEPAVLVANHASYLDSVVLLAVLPPGIRFVAKRELLATPLVAAVIRRVGHLTVERVDLSRSVTDAEIAAAALRRGHSLLFFPEGTFVRPPGLLPFRLGAFKAAVENGRPVVPIAIRGTRDILPAGTLLPRPGPIAVAIGAPLRPRAGGWPELVRLRDEARAAIGAACGEPALARRPELPAAA
jgi:fatty-acyl-CoA synthase